MLLRPEIERIAKTPRPAGTFARASFVASCLVLASCSGERVDQPPAAPVSWQSLKEQPSVDAGGDIVTAKERALPDAYAAALASSGFAALGSLLDEDAHFASPGMSDAHGREGVVRAHEVLLGAFDQRKLALSRVWRTPNEQTLEWSLTAVQARDWMGVPATSKPVGFKGLTLLWTKDDGSVTDVHVYFDVAVVKAQLGVGPKELQALPLATSPTGSAQVFEQAATGTSDIKPGVNLVKASLDDLENDQEAAYVASMSDDFECYSLERAEPTRHKDAARAYFRSMRKAIGQLDTTVENAWGVSQFAIVEYTITGEQLGPIGWIPSARERVIGLELVDICEIQGAKIARIWRYENPAQFAGDDKRQGALPHAASSAPKSAGGPRSLSPDAGGARFLSADAGR